MNRLQFFTVSTSCPEAVGSELNSFLAAHRILAIDKHFVDNGASSFWSICVTYTDAPEGTAGKRKAQQQKVDYRKILSEEDFARFVQLRDLRNRLAREEGVVPYMVFNNEQLAQMVQGQLRSRTALLGISGVGEARVEKYGSEFERAMVAHTYACRPGKGVHRAVEQVQKNLRRFPWFVKIDISGYFAAINHARLLEVLAQRFKGQEILEQFERVVASYYDTPGRGLPIGSLTSQYFANYYLDGLDRLLGADPAVRAMVRYMDDIVWWCDTKQQARRVLAGVKAYLRHERDLAVKPEVQILRSAQGISYCGFRILPGIVRMSRRRKRRFLQRRLYWENLYQAGVIDAHRLQTAVSAVYAIAQGTDSLAWRRKNLRQYPPPEV